MRGLLADQLQNNQPDVALIKHPAACAEVARIPPAASLGPFARRAARGITVNTHGEPPAKPVKIYLDKIYLDIVCTSWPPNFFFRKALNEALSFSRKRPVILFPPKKTRKRD